MLQFNQLSRYELMLVITCKLEREHIDFNRRSKAAIKKKGIKEVNIDT